MGRNTLAVLLACALLGATIQCNDPAHDGPCDSWETYFLDNPTHVHLYEHSGQLHLLAMHYSASWHPVQPNGTMAPASGHVVDLPLGFSTIFTQRLLVIPEGDRALRILTTDRVQRLVDGERPGEGWPYESAPDSLLPMPFFVALAWQESDGVGLVWAAETLEGTGLRRLAGLGRLEGDTSVRAVGQPFYDTLVPEDEAGFVFRGGWDPGVERLYLDLPGGREGVVLDAAGQVTFRYTIETSGPYYLSWIPLPRWPADVPTTLVEGTAAPMFAGLHGSHWNAFTLQNRDSRGWVSMTERFAPMYTTNPDQRRAPDGTLWVAIAVEGGVVLRRWHEDLGTFGYEFFSPLILGTCDIALSWF